MVVEPSRQGAVARLPPRRVAARRRAVRDPRRRRRDRGAAPLGPQSRIRRCGAPGRSTRRPRPCSTCIAVTSLRAATSSPPPPGRSSRRPRPSSARGSRDGEPSHWIDIARLGIQLARKATVEAGREQDCAVAFAISEEVNSPRRRQTIELLARMFADDPPDMLLLETLTLIRDPATFEMVELLLETGLPVWLSYRRCRHGVCGVYGQHWGPPEGDLFGRAARRFEQMGVEALLINCLPVDHVPGHRLVAARLHRAAARRLPEPRPSDRAALAVRRDDRARGLRRARARLARRGRADRRRLLRRHVRSHRGARPRARRRPSRAAAGRHCSRTRLRSAEAPRQRNVPERLARRARRRPVSAAAAGAHDRVGRVRADAGQLPGLEAPLPDSARATACAASTSAAAAASRRCSSRSTARRTCTRSTSTANAIANTVSNAYRNGVGDRVSGDDVDLYQWTSDERYDLIVASLYQMPVDPYEEPSGHRPLDYWGRNQLDHFLGRLPRPARPTTAARSSCNSPSSGRRRRRRRLAQEGLTARVARLHLLPVRVAVRGATSRRSSASSRSPTRTT